MNDKPHIIIIGGGAGGIELATKLGKKLGKKNKANITLVDRNLTHIWKPLFHEVAAGTIDSHEDELSYAAHAYYHHFQYQLGELSELDRKNKTVKLNIDENETTILHYDFLVLAIGSITNNFNIKGTDQYCYTLDSRHQTDALHRRFIHHLMIRSEKMLNVAIVGGGPTGVELAAELDFSLKQAAKYGFDTVASKHAVRMSLIEATDRILPALPDNIAKLVTEKLESYGIKVLTNTVVDEVTADSIHIKSGESLPVDIVIWTAGIKGQKIAQGLDGLEVNQTNQFVVSQQLQTSKDENIFAIGDCAYCIQDDGLVVPARAQAAHQQASTLAKTFVNKLKNKPAVKYKYSDYGTLVSVSHEGTIGHLMLRIANVTVAGFVAWILYLSLYKLHQISLHGYWRTSIMTLAKSLSHRVKPKLKLH